MALSLVEQRGHVLVGQRVHALAPAPLGDDQTVIAQQPELVRHGGLGHARGRDQLADRAVPTARMRTRLGVARANIVSAIRSASSSVITLHGPYRRPRQQAPLVGKAAPGVEGRCRRRSVMYICRHYSLRRRRERDRRTSEASVRRTSRPARCGARGPPPRARAVRGSGGSCSAACWWSRERRCDDRRVDQGRDQDAGQRSELPQGDDVAPRRTRAGRVRGSADDPADRQRSAQPHDDHAGAPALERDAARADRPEQAVDLDDVDPARADGHAQTPTALCRLGSTPR